MLFNCIYDWFWLHINPDFVYIYEVSLDNFFCILSLFLCNVTLAEDTTSDPDFEASK